MTCTEHKNASIDRTYLSQNCPQSKSSPKTEISKGMNEQVSQITARQLKADYLCKLTMPSVPTLLTPDKIPKTSPHPSEQILLILFANVYTQIPRYREI